MKVLVINGSPHKDKGNTAKILNPFIEGMKEANANVELLFIKELKIQPCNACFSCWGKTLGECCIKDDMKTILQKWKESNIIVIASPLHSNGFSSATSILFERRMPLFKPFIFDKDNHFHHPLQYNNKNNKMVLVSTCAFWQLNNFDPIISQFKENCKMEKIEYGGALLRPQAPALTSFDVNKNIINKIFEASFEAGKQLVINGNISSNILNKISQDIMPKHEYIQKYNNFFQTIIDLAKEKSLLEDEEELFCY